MLITSKDGKCYQLLDKIGFGSFGECFKGFETTTKEEVACKFMAKNTSLIKTHLFEKEVSIHKSLSHRNIVRFIDSFEDDENIYILTRFCPEDNLEEYVRKRHPLPKYVSQIFMYQLLQAVKYLHEREIIHMDLKPKNVFLNEECTVKLGDFGLATHLSDAESMSGIIMGSTKYISPEISSFKNFGLEVDIWGYGCIMHYVLLGFTAYENERSKKCVDIKGKLPNSAYRLLMSLLKENPQDRPSLNQIENHIYFKEIPDDEPKRMPPTCELDSDSSNSVSSLSPSLVRLMEKIKNGDTSKDDEEIHLETISRQESGSLRKWLRQIEGIMKRKIETDEEIDTQAINKHEIDNQSKSSEQELQCVVDVDDENCELVTMEISDQREPAPFSERYEGVMIFAMKYGFHIIIFVLVIIGVILSLTMFSPFF